MASTRSRRSISQRKSGKIRSTPYMVGSGNMSPASTITMRLSCSKARQFRPISPRPPRKVTRKESLATRGRKRGSNLGRLIVTGAVTRSERQSTLTYGETQCPQGGLGRYGIGIKLGAFPRATHGQSLVALPRLFPVAFFHAAHDGRELGGGPVRGHRNNAHRTSGHESKQHAVVAAVEIKFVAQHRLGVGRFDQIARRVLEGNHVRQSPHQTDGGRRMDLATGARGNVVEH